MSGPNTHIIAESDSDAAAHVELVKNVVAQGKLEKAIEHLRAAILFMMQKNHKEGVVKLQAYLQALLTKQSQKKD